MEQTKKCSCGNTIGHWKEHCTFCDRKDAFYSKPYEFYLKELGIPPKTARETSELYPHAFGKYNTPQSTIFEETFQKSVFLTGTPGTGKTTLAIAMMIYHLEQYKATGMKRVYNNTFLFKTCPEMLQSIKYSFSQLGSAEEKLIKLYQNVDYLVLDDFGVESTTDWSATALYIILTHRYEYEKTTVFTSNLDIDQLAGKFGDERITRRIASQCRIIHLKK